MTSRPRRDVPSVAVNGPVLRFIRRLVGVSTRDLAEEVGVGESFIRNLESGHSPAMSPAAYGRVMRRLGVKDRRVLAMPAATETARDGAA